MSQLKKKPIIIIDGSLYLYRSYYTFPDFTNNLGKPSGAIYGMIKTIKSILKKYSDSKKIIIIFDSFKTTFRKKLFPQYKSNRKRMPQSLYVQIEPLLKIITGLGIKTLSIAGIEADDLIGSLSFQLEKKGENVLIVSHDKDMLQLVTNKINIWHINTNKIITPDKIQKKYGIQPKEWIDFLALMGDASDNIPGVPKIGKKTALALLQAFSNIKNIYNNIDDIKNLSFRNSKNIEIQLKKNKEIAFLSYKLVKIKLDIVINIDLEDMTLKKPCFDTVSSLFKLYNFKKWNEYFK